MVDNREVFIERDHDMERMVDRYRARDFALEGAGDERASRILRRSMVVGSSVYFVRGASRLMELARRIVADREGRGVSFPSGTVYMAGNLPGARGRLSRSWWAPEGGIYLCIAFHPVLLEKNWHLYGLGAGVAVAQVLREWGVDARLRWVNDVMLGEKKVAGMLAEVVKGGHGTDEWACMLLGLGLNVNMDGFPPDLPHAGSLMLSTGRAWPIRPLAAHILARTGWVFGGLEDWEAGVLEELEWGHEPPGNPVVRAWRQVASTLGQRVAYGLDAENSPEFFGLALDMDWDGGLKIATDEGQEVKVFSGEVRPPGHVAGGRPR